MNTQSLIFSFLVIGTLAGLVWLATMGSLMAVITLSVITTILIFLAGSLLTIKTVKVMNDRAQQQFYDNAQENLGIMQQLQSIQNKQNQTLMQQLGQVSRLPDNNGYKPVFQIEDTVFNELEQ